MVNQAALCPPRSLLALRSRRPDPGSPGLDVLQVLEAMASGLPAVCTATAGVSSFATANVDCLMAPVGQPAELAQHVLSVLEDAALASRLAAAARQTAQRFTPDRVTEQLERVLYSLTACRQELMALRLQAMPDSQLAAAAAVKACAGAAAAHKAALKARQQRQAAALGAGEQACGLHAHAGRPEEASRLDAAAKEPVSPAAAAQQAPASLRHSLEQQQQQQQLTQQAAAPSRQAEERGRQPPGSPPPAAQLNAGQAPADSSPRGSTLSLAGSASSAATQEQCSG